MLVTAFSSWSDARCVEIALTVPQPRGNDPSQAVQRTEILRVAYPRGRTPPEEPDAVRLSTLHAAKGLEFGHVFLVGIEENILPHREAVDEGRLEEERRLMYVGVTRAKKSLTLSYCSRRKRARESVACDPSRFIDELGDDVRMPDKPSTAETKARGSDRRAALKAMLG